MTDEIRRQEGWFCETILWNARDELEGPSRGWKMFASSGPDENIEHLLADGYKPHEIIIITYGEHETVWIPKYESVLERSRGTGVHVEDD